MKSKLSHISASPIKIVFFLNSFNDLGGYIYKHEDKESSFFKDLAIGVAIDFDEGRDPADLKDRPELQELNKVDATLEAKIFAEAEISFIEFGIALAQDLAEGHNGWYTELYTEVDLPVSNRFFLNAKSSFRYSSDDFQQSFYSVDALESTATSLAEYTPASGFDRAAFSITGAYALTKHWRILGQVRYEQLLDDKRLLGI